VTSSTPGADTPDTPDATPPPPPPGSFEPGPGGAAADLHARLDAALAGEARAWLEKALAEAASPIGGTATPATTRALPTWQLRFAEAGRRLGAEHAEAARVLLLLSARPDEPGLTRIYTQGSAAERRAVLQALPHLVPGPGALPLVEDALRTNDTRLLAAAVGPYAARHLGTHSWRHAVLKCLFTGVPVAAVAELRRRAHQDFELARMLGDYAEERRAASRPVPEDLYRVLALTAPIAPTAPAAGEES
jgi:hypothetical protein